MIRWIQTLSGLALLLISGVFTHAQNLPGADQSKIQDFLINRGYQNWPSQVDHLSGVETNGLQFAVHGYVKVYFSEGVQSWIDNGVFLPLANDQMIVALEYTDKAHFESSPNLPLRAQTMVRQGGKKTGGPYDGWFWSSIEFTREGGSLKVVPAKSWGKFGASECFSCHSGADNESLVFLDKNGPLLNRPAWSPDAGLAATNAPPVIRQPLQPLPSVNQAFLDFYQVKNVPDSAAKKTAFPQRSYDHVWAGFHAGVTMKDRELYLTSDQCIGCHNAAQLLPNTAPNMWYAEPDPETTLVDGPQTTDAKAFRNYSPYGEWSASLNALSGRDPVWHAQVDFERKLRPELEDFTTDTCFSCHGPMAGRQLKLDRGTDSLFTRDMFYAKPGEDDAKYGALARDGVSCAVCHQIPADNLGVDPIFKPRPNGGFFLPQDLKTYTAMFPNPTPTNGEGHPYYGPYPDDETLSVAMDKVLGQRALHAPQISESRLCGSCHTVLVPALPVGYKLPSQYKSPFEDPKTKMSFEQTTYFEWRNSIFNNETNTADGIKVVQDAPTGVSCQGCHMASHHNNPSHRIVNAMSNRLPEFQRKQANQEFQKHDPIYRHVLLGINYFVFEMYEQFPELLGAYLSDDRVPDRTLDSVINARDWIENHAKRATATVRVTDLEENVVVDGEKYLEAEVEVTNHAGHKFPTGAGFRRAFIRFDVLDTDGNVLWASGRFSQLGVLEGPPTPGSDATLLSETSTVPGQSQPHHQIITRQDQVQIYETRALSSEVELQTTVLGIYYEYKDNRILPLGYQTIEDDDITSRKATAAVLVGDPALQPPGVQIKPPPGVNEEATHHPTQLDDGSKPFKVVYDPDYWLPEQAKMGQDHVRYRIPLAQIEGWAEVRAQLFYQTIPPYYLRDRFETGKEATEQLPKGDDMHRLIHVASRLNLKDSPAENWSLEIGAPVTTKRGAAPQARMDSAEAWRLLREHYNYLPLAESPNN